MKFEQLLQVYWSKGFLYGGRIRSFDLNLRDFFDDCSGMSSNSKLIFIKRFELNEFSYEVENKFTLFRLDYRKILNMYFSQITSINNNIFELIKLNLVRLYLIKSRRGRAHALGRPSRGQRTWSNAWNAYRCNRTTRLFISDIVRNNVVKKTPDVINFKKIKKKIKKPQIKIKMGVVKKSVNLWF